MMREPLIYLTVSQLSDIIEQAKREALENAARELEEWESNDYIDPVAIVRGLIPEPDLGVWTQEQVDSINERAARRAEALAPLIEGDTDV